MPDAPDTTDVEVARPADEAPAVAQAGEHREDEIRAVGFLADERWAAGRLAADRFPVVGRWAAGRLAADRLPVVDQFPVVGPYLVVCRGLHPLRVASQVVFRACRLLPAAKATDRPRVASGDRHRVAWRATARHPA